MFKISLITPGAKIVKSQSFRVYNVDMAHTDSMFWDLGLIQWCECNTKVTLVMEPSCVCMKRIIRIYYIAKSTNAITHHREL